MKSSRIIIIITAIILILAFLAWLFIESSKPLPGEKIASNCDNFTDFSKIENADTSDKCRVHVSDGIGVNYSTNPPTLGPHSASWITKGFYDTARLDGNLVHSMEHGYIIVWYDCVASSLRKQGSINNWIPAFAGMTVYAQGMTGGSEGSPSASLENMPKSFSDGTCDSLKNQIKEVIKISGDHKLIAVPRVGMDSKIVLTAWGRILKLDSVDQNKIKGFIDAFRDNGPERTAEP